MTDSSESQPRSPTIEPSSSAPAAPRRGGAISLTKIGLIAGLALATIVPNYFIAGLVGERETRQDAVEKEFARTWGPQQQIYGPVLVVPYQYSGGRSHLKIAPARLDVVASLDPQERRRGLFHATVYDAKVDLQGIFLLPAEARMKESFTGKDGRFLWDESFVAFGTTSNLTGLRAEDQVTINGVATPWQPCEETARPEQDCKGVSVVTAGVRLDPAAAGGTKIPFKSAISLRGTGVFNVLALGKEVDVTLRSPWRTPSFGGDILPLSSTVTASGFEARWQVSEFGAPRLFGWGSLVDPAMLKVPVVGVELIEATPIYRMITRVAKYGLLFVVLSFATYFFFELLSRLRIHVVQYGLLGLSLSLFALLLLSLSEPIGYTAGYVVSAALVLIQSTAYTAAIARRAAPALGFAGMLASLFVFLYVLLGLETYSLLVGAFSLFAVVSVLMVLTQCVNWSAWSLAGGAVE